jgi:UDP-glucuronate decarboxylase
MNKRDILLNIIEKDARYVNERINLSSLDGLSLTITGATGLVGLNIINAINYYNLHSAENPINVNALSFNKPTGIIHYIFKANNIRSISGDLSDMSFVKEVPFSDCVIHSAGYGQPGKFLDEKLKTISINTSATIELSTRLKENGRFLYLSSSEIYSGCSSLKNVESDIGTTTPSHPRSCYIEGKRSGEAIINILREKGINASAARLALAYGPGVKNNDERVLNQFIRKGIMGSINLLDSGDSNRTYGYISDVVIMLLNLLIKSNKSVYNVGGNSIVTIGELANKIGQLMNVEVHIPKVDSYLNDAPKSVGLDLSRIEKEYGHREYINIDEGLKNTIEWIKNYE